MLLTRRKAIAGLGGGLASLAGGPALAQTAYPVSRRDTVPQHPASVRWNSPRRCLHNR